MVESCAGQSASLDAIQWRAAPGPLINPENNAESVTGYWSAASNRIVLDFNDTINGSVVRHEMLHAFVHVSGHPRSAFLENCGGIVSCGTACIHDAGPAPTPDASIRRVYPSELEVTSDVFPQTPSAATDGGLATFTVAAHNPLPYPIVVLLAAGGIAKTFHYDMRDATGGGVRSDDYALDPSVTFFKAGETKYDVFDFFVLPPGSPPFTRVSGLGDNGIALQTGSYIFRADYAGQAAPDRSVVLGP